MSLPAPESVLIVGAGDLGLGVANRLAESGRAVTTLNRSGRSVAAAAPYVGDLSDAASLRQLAEIAPPAGWDQVIFTTAPPGRESDAYELAYVDGPRRLLAALPRLPRRAVLISTTGVIGVDDGSWVDETTGVSPRRKTAEIVLRGEELLREQVPTTVIRPAGIYGPDRRGLRDRVASGDAPVASDGTPRWTNRIHRDDLVAAISLVATHVDPPPIVLAVDDEPSPRDDVIRFLTAALEGPEPATVDVASPTGKRCRNTLLRSLGWTPKYPSYRDGYQAIIEG